MTRKLFAGFPIVCVVAFTASAALFVLPQRTEAAVSFVQSFSENRDGFGNDWFLPTMYFYQGDVLVVAVSYESVPITLTLTDAGNTYYPIGAALYDSRTDQSMQLFYAPVTVGGDQNINVSPSAGRGNMRIVIHDVSGVRLTNPIDQVASSSSQTGTALTSGTATTHYNGEYIFAVALNDNNVPADTFSPGMPCTERDTASPGNNELESEDRVQTSSGSLSATWTMSGAHDAMTAMVTLVPASPTFGGKLMEATSTNNVTTLTTPTFTPPDNSLLVAAVSGLDVPGSVGGRTLTVSGGSLTWTRRQSVLDAGNAYATQIWTAPVTTGAPMTVTYGTFGAGSEINMHVFAYTGYDTANPIGATASGSAGTHSGAFSMSLNRAPRATSEVLAVVASDDPSSLSPGTGWTERQYTVTDDDQQETETRNNSNSTTVTWNSIDTNYGLFATAVEVNARQALLRPANNLGLVGYWPMDEGTSTQAGDFSGQGHTGTLSGSTLPSWINGKRGQALKFDGSSNYVNIGTNSAFDFTTGNVTVSFWMKSNSSATFPDSSPLVSRRVSGVGWGVQTNAVNNVEFCFGGCVDGTRTINDRTWHLITVVRTSTTNANFYVDGVLDTTGTISDESSQSNALHFASSSNNDAFSNISMDDVRIYNRALSASEVVGLYAGGTAGAARANASSVTLTNGTTLGPANGLVGHWTFDGADVAKAVYDRSGQNNNGYIFNSATGTMETIGKLGQALRFDGVDDYVNAGTGASISITGSMTVAAWVKFTSFGDASDDTIASKTSDDVDGQLGWTFSGTVDNGPEQFHFSLSKDGVAGNGFGRYSNTTLQLNTWYHLVGVYDATALTVSVYVNGVQDNGTLGGTVQSSMHNSTRSLLVGARDCTCGPSEPGAGIFDDVRVYNRALTAAEVKQLYKLGGVTIKQ